MAYTVYNFQDNNDVKKIAEKGQFSVSSGSATFRFLPGARRPRGSARK